MAPRGPETGEVRLPGLGRPQHDLDGLRLAVAHEGDLHVVTGLVRAHPRRELELVADGSAVDGGDAIALLQTGLVSRRAGGDGHHDRPVADAAGRRALDTRAHAQEGELHRFAGDELVGDRLGQVDRYEEPEADVDVGAGDRVAHPEHATLTVRDRTS